ncbi:S10 family peptidase [Thiotrichales bacterium 19X7-9]|nr:S10 family peptidase [Thiotrichales bacterium 19X7-9]
MLKRCHYFLLLLLFVLPSFVLAQEADQIKTLPGISKLNQIQYAGYAKNIYYWYIQSKENNDHTPIIIWTSGGPGTSSLYGLFKENGPYSCHLNKQNQPIFQAATDHADWSKFSNYLVFDQPLGIGLSFTTKKNLPTSPETGNLQYYNAVKAFFNKHPNLKSHDIYLAGESYGGTYMALLANSILNDPANQLKLKGIIIISGWVAPKIQYKSMPMFAYTHGLIDFRELKQSQALYQQCATCNNQSTDCNQTCSKLDDYITQSSGLNLHDIADTNQDSNWQKGGWVNCLNSPITRQAIHAKPNQPYQPMTNIWDLYGRLQLDSVIPIYQKLLKNKIKLLVISGLNDGSPSGYWGTRLWITSLGLNDKQLNQTKWYHKNKLLGYKVQLSPKLLWVKVLNAGHTVPTQQPLISEIVKSFIA